VTVSFAAFLLRNLSLIVCSGKSPPSPPVVDTTNDPQPMITQQVDAATTSLVAPAAPLVEAANQEKAIVDAGTLASSSSSWTDHVRSSPQVLNM
jgi:hypothetical protein